MDCYELYEFLLSQFDFYNLRMSIKNNCNGHHLHVHNMHEQVWSPL